MLQMSRFKFKSLKQKQGATVAYMAELKVPIKECSYEQNLQNILFKDQFICGVTVCEIQEHLLNEIGDDHGISQCLQEARKIESHIAQCKLLGLRSVQYDSTGNQRDHGRSKKKSKPKDRYKSRSQSGIRVQTINEDSVQLMGRLVRHVVKRTILPRSAILGKAKAKALVVLITNPLNTEK